MTGKVGGFASWIDFDKLGAVRFVGLSVLKWASVSSSPSPGALHGYLVVIPPHFLGFALILPFIPKEIT